MCIFDFSNVIKLMPKLTCGAGNTRHNVEDLLSHWDLSHCSDALLFSGVFCGSG